MLCTCPHHRETYDDDQHDRCPKCAAQGTSVVVCRPEELARVRQLMLGMDCCEEAGAFVVVTFRGFTAQAQLPDPVGGCLSLQSIEAGLARSRTLAAQRRATGEEAAA